MAKTTARTASLTAQNTFGGSVEVRGLFNFSLSGTWVGTVHLQRSFDAGSSWLDVDSFTSNVETFGTESEDGVYYRVGVKTGNYTSGTVVERVSQ